MEYFLSPKELKKIYANNPSLLLNASALLAQVQLFFQQINAQKQTHLHRKPLRRQAAAGESWQSTD
jgi:hypothetical protein